MGDGDGMGAIVIGLKVVLIPATMGAFLCVQGRNDCVHIYLTKTIVRRPIDNACVQTKTFKYTGVVT